MSRQLIQSAYLQTVAWFKHITQTKRGTVALVLGIVLFSLTTFSSWQFKHWQNYSLLADAFGHGQLHFRIAPESLGDSAVVGGKIYWPLGPLPAVVLVPLAAINPSIPWQTATQWLLVAGMISAAYALARQHKYTTPDSLWLAITFVFGSIMIGVVFKPHPWQFAACLSTLAGLLALHEYLGNKRLIIVGMYLAAAFATRFTAGLIIVPLLLHLALTPGQNLHERGKQLLRVLVPVLITGLVLLWYNYARFGNPLDNGYWGALVSPPPQIANRAEYGLFQLRNILSNFYYYFLAAPVAHINTATQHMMPPFVTAGMATGFVFLSPLFLHSWRTQLTTLWHKLVALGALGITVVLLSYYSILYFLLGTYYLADVLPLYYILLLLSFKDSKLEPRHCVYICISLAFNLYLLFTIR